MRFRYTAIKEKITIPKTQEVKIIDYEPILGNNNLYISCQRTQ